MPRNSDDDGDAVSNCIFILDKAVQFANAKFPIAAEIVPGKITLFNEVHLLNIYGPIVVTPGGIIIDAKLVQLSKILLFVKILLFGNIMLVKPVHDANA